MRCAAASGSGLSTGTSVPGGTTARPGSHAWFSYTIAPGSMRDTARSSCAASEPVSAGSGRPCAPESGAARVTNATYRTPVGPEQVAEPDRVLILDEGDRVPEHAFRVTFGRCPQRPRVARPLRG